MIVVQVTKRENTKEIITIKKQGWLYKYHIYIRIEEISKD